MLLPGDDCQTVYALSISGIAYCIIRNPPWYGMDRSGGVVLFDGQQGQTVLEGLTVGLLNVLAAAGLIVSYRALTSKTPLYSVL